MTDEQLFFVFEGFSEAEITQEKTVIFRDYVIPENEGNDDPVFVVEFKGFPTYEAAREFVLFGDFGPLEHNDFLRVTGRDYHLTAERH